MPCGACGHDYCQGNCPPNRPLVYEDCRICCGRHDWEDLDDFICRECKDRGFTSDTTVCHQCGVELTWKEVGRGEGPYQWYADLGIVCPDCAAREILK